MKTTTSLVLLLSVILFVCYTSPATALSIRLDYTFVEQANDNEGQGSQSCYSLSQTYVRGNQSITGLPQCSDNPPVPYDACVGYCDNTNDLVQADVVAFVKDLLNSAANTLSSLFTVKDSAGWEGVPAGVQRCQYLQNYGVNIPSSYRAANAASNYDTVIFVTMRPLESYINGQGMYCLTSDTTGRPIMGVLNIPPHLTLQTNTTIQSYMLREMMHILGWHVDMFRSRPSMDVKQYFTMYGSVNETLYYVEAPKAMQEARDHFACTDASLTKILLLENKMGPDPRIVGQSNPIISHMHVRDNIADVPNDKKSYSIWEARIFGNDIMTGQFTDRAPAAPAISRMTLAIMEDLGFYDVNYSPSDATASRLVKSFTYGRGMGCSFLTARCENWPTTRTGYFCSDTSSTLDANTALGCIFDHTRKGKCTATGNQNALTIRYQHFSSPFIGGVDEWRDFCPIFTGVGFPAGNCADSRYQDQSNYNTFGEEYGDNSRCFMSSAKRDLYANENTYARCYRTACGPYNSTDANTMHLFIKVGTSKWRRCPILGGNVNDFDSFTGSISCPPAAVVCQGRSANFDTTIVTQSNQDTKGGDVKEQIRKLPFWIWIIIGVVVGLVVLITIICLAIILFRKYANRDWETKKTVDLRDNQEVDIEH